MAALAIAPEEPRPQARLIAVTVPQQFKAHSNSFARKGGRE